MVATRAQLANLIGQYTKGLTNTAANAQQKIENLQKALSEQKSRVLELKLQRAQLDILQRGVDNAQRSSIWQCRSWPNLQWKAVPMLLMWPS